MTRLILVRHGNTFDKNEVPRFVGAKTDLPLTEFGKKQAEAAADYLRKNSILPTAVFHGPLKRQSETAGIIAARLRISNIIESTQLSEIDYGLWENLSAEEIRFMWPEEFKNWETGDVWPENVFPVKELFVWENLQRWLTTIEKELKGQTVLAVSSNGILRIIKKIIEGDNFRFKDAKVRTGAICSVELNGAVSNIKFWNVLP